MMDKCNHPSSPGEYLAYLSWKANISKTHKRSKCPVCGKWSVWVEKQKRVK